MPQPPKQTIRQTDDAARQQARSLIDHARFGALGVIDPETGGPSVSRVALATTAGGAPLTLISDLSHHTAALRSDARCSLLLGEPGERGDPLTHPRVTLLCAARFIDRTGPEHQALRARYLRLHPKAQLYIDFADFGFVLFEVSHALLNGGFGKAYRLTPADLRPGPHP